MYLVYDCYKNNFSSFMFYQECNINCILSSLCGSGELLIYSENKACNHIFVKHLENNECHNTITLHVMLIRLSHE